MVMGEVLAELCAIPYPGREAAGRALTLLNGYAFLAGTQ
jgi:hypothetical protein